MISYNVAKLATLIWTRVEHKCVVNINNRQCKAILVLPNNLIRKNEVAMRPIVVLPIVIFFVSLFALPSFANTDLGSVGAPDFTNNTLHVKSSYNFNSNLFSQLPLRTDETVASQPLQVAGNISFNSLGPKPPRPRGRHRRGGYFHKGPTLAGGFSSGGDILATIDGEELSAGGGKSIHIGGNLDFKSGRESRVSIQVTVGFRSSAIAEDTVSFATIPVDGILYYQYHNFRIGAGIAYHLFPTFSTSKTTENKFNNQLGFTMATEFVETRYAFFTFALSVRYTIITYTPEFGSYLYDNVVVTEVDGSSGGVFLSLHWK